MALHRVGTENVITLPPEGAPPSCCKGPLRYPKLLSKGYLRGPLLLGAVAESDSFLGINLIITDGCPVVGHMHQADAADAHWDFNFHNTINSDLVPGKIIQLQICLSMGQVCLITVIYRPKTRYNIL